MTITSRIRALITPVQERAVMGYPDWLQTFVFNGHTYPIPQFSQTLHGEYEDVEQGFTQLVLSAFMSNTIVFATETVRLAAFSEARFKFRSTGGPGTGKLFGKPELSILEHPWTGAVTGDLLTRMLLYADFAGTGIVVRSKRNAKTYGQLRVPRPDWFTLVMGSDRNPDDPAIESDAELVGVMYHPGGHNSGNKPEVFLPGEFAIFTPIPDPLARFRGVPWPAVAARDIASDNAMTQHKRLFMANGATPNMVVTLDPAILQAEYEAWVEEFKKSEPVGSKAFKTLYLGGGAKVDVVGVDFQKLDLKATQGAGETRIAAASGVPSVIANLSEGLSGSSLNAGNYAAARRRLSDITIRPLWRNVCGALESIVPPPGGSELWYDENGIAFLREDAKDRAEIQSIQAQSIVALGNAGWKPETVRDAVIAEDWTLLDHTGNLSVQLQPGGMAPPAPVAPPPARSAEELVATAMTRVYQTMLDQRTAPQVTIEAGAIRNEIHTPDVAVTLPEQAAPVVNVTLPEQAAPVVTFEDGAFQTTVEPASVTVNVPEQPAPSVTFAPGAIAVEAPAPAEVNVSVEAPVVTVEPQITVEVPSPRSVTKTVKRNAKGEIEQIVESPDGD